MVNVKIILATKFHGRMEDRDPNAMGSSRRHIIEQCEASLKRLKTDYIEDILVELEKCLKLEKPPSSGKYCSNCIWQSQVHPFKK